ncbi:MAG: hypothetical protein ACKPKO_54580, partial [Candidatus Fonsibacter sp.]
NIAAIDTFPGLSEPLDDVHTLLASEQKEEPQAQQSPAYDEDTEQSAEIVLNTTIHPDRTDGNDTDPKATNMSDMGEESSLMRQVLAIPSPWRWTTRGRPSRPSRPC